MIKIYHNPRCSKSRAGLSILEQSGKEFEVVRYLDNTLSVKELSDIIKKLNIGPIDLVRKNEQIWKDSFTKKTLSNSEIIEILIEHPKLMERPIVINGKNAVIGRPIENINTII